MSNNRVDNPFFARMWTILSAHEPESLRKLRRENLAGLSGRVLEVGAGTGSNFVLYPTSVDEVVAIEPEHRLDAIAGRAAAMRPCRSGHRPHRRGASQPDAPFDAVVCSLVLCSVDDAGRRAAATVFAAAAGRRAEISGTRGQRRRPGPVAAVGGRDVWPRLAGNCHTHRDTEQAIATAGFVRRPGPPDWTLPSWVPMPVSEFALGRASAPGLIRSAGLERQ